MSGNALLVTTEDQSVYKLQPRDLYQKSVTSEMQVQARGCCVAAYLFTNDAGQSIVAMIAGDCGISFYNETTNATTKFGFEKHKLSNCRFLDLDQLSGSFVFQANIEKHSHILVAQISKQMAATVTGKFKVNQYQQQLCASIQNNKIYLLQRENDIY